jgi:ApaG protein
VTDKVTEKKLFVDGDGVVGVFPVLAPGETFSYNSSHLIDNPSVAEGAYIVEDEDHEQFHVLIPPFALPLPDTEVNE